MANPKKRRKLIVFTIIALALVALVLVAVFRRREDEVTVQTDKVKRRDLTELVVANGKIQPVLKVTISPEVSGEIIELPVKEGQVVKKGDLILKIKPDFYVAARNQAEASYKSALSSKTISEANLEKAGAEFKRNEELFQNKLISESVYTEVKTAFDIAKAQLVGANHQIEMSKAQLARAEEDLSKTTIVSPLDGTISKLNSQVGERVVGTATMAGTDVMTIADLNEMEARVDVGEMDVVLIQPGQRARLEVDAFNLKNAPRRDRFAGFRGNGRSFRSCSLRNRSICAGSTRKPQCFDLPGRRQEHFSVMIIAWQLQHIPARSAGEFAGQHQKVAADRLDRCSPILLGQAKPLEPMHQVIGEQQQLKERHVGRPLLGRDFVQRQMMQQLPDGFLDVGARVIGPPDILRLQRQVGDVGRILESAHLHQGQLIGLVGSLFHGAPHHNEAMGLFPFLRPVFKVGDTPAKMHGLETGVMRRRQEVFHLGGHDEVAAARLVQMLHERPAKVTRVGQKTNPRPRHVRGNFFQTPVDHEAGAGIGGRIARTQRAMPELLAVSFKAQNGMIGGAALLPGIVALPSALLLAIQGEDHRIHVKLQLRARLRQAKQLFAQPVMQPDHFPNGGRWQTPQEPAQRGLIWKRFQSDQGEKQSVVLENLRLVHALNAGDQDVEERQDHVRRAIRNPPGRGFEDALEPTPQVKPVTKSLNQEQAAEVRQGLALERKLQCLQALSHGQHAQTGAPAPVSISSHFVRLLTPNQKCRLTPQNQCDCAASSSNHALLRFKDRKFSGMVTEIANSAKGAGTAAASQSAEATKFEVRIRIKEKEQFRPGMSVNTEIETRYRTNVLTVPIAAVTTRPPKPVNAGTNAVAGGRVPSGAAANTNAVGDADPAARDKKAKDAAKPVEVVFVVEGETVRQAPVKLGVSDADYYEIVEGLTEGQEIVTGNYKAMNKELEDGKRIHKSNGAMKAGRPEPK